MFLKLYIYIESAFAKKMTLGNPPNGESGNPVSILSLYLHYFFAASTPN